MGQTQTHTTNEQQMYTMFEWRDDFNVDYVALHQENQDKEEKEVKELQKRERSLQRQSCGFCGFLMRFF